MSRILPLVAIACLCKGSFSGTLPECVPLWPDGVPLQLAKDGWEHNPSLQWFLAPETNRTRVAIVVYPGGGYSALADEKEGVRIARWLNAHGITAVVCRYRLGSAGYHHPVEMQDGLQAVRQVRKRAGALGVDKVGVIGFSAGGHLASTVLTHFEGPETRPDFGILAYPVVQMGTRFTHWGSQNCLLGPRRDEQEVQVYLSNERMVSPETPPVFIFHTDEDTGVPVENSLAFYRACRNNGVPAEMHVFAKGPHGLGLADGREDTGVWPDLCLTWLRVMGFMGR